MKSGETVEHWVGRPQGRCQTGKTLQINEAADKAANRMFGKRFGRGEPFCVRLLVGAFGRAFFELDLSDLLKKRIPMHHTFLQKASAGVLTALVTIGLIGAAQAAGSIEEFQKRVNEAAAKAGVAAPDVRKELAGEPGSSVRNETRTGKSIERIVTIPADQVRVVKPSGGAPLVFIIGNGRFAFTGPLIDVWEKKKLTTLEEIEAAVNRVDLQKLGFQAEKLNLIRVGEGQKVITVFLDPLCGWCHRLLREIQEDKAFLKEYRLDLIVAAVLGEQSRKLARLIACADATDQQKYEALLAGARTIETLKQKSDCKGEALARTELTLGAMGITASPFVIAPDGRISRGKPTVLRDFLEAPHKAQSK